jgi:hypothetical protein
MRLTLQRRVSDVFLVNVGWIYILCRTVVSKLATRRRMLVYAPRLSFVTSNIIRVVFNAHYSSTLMKRE